ncbi:hypothetical protein [Nonomuraea endophytica]|uniref:Uncharacterized protein n=1 Tax=Nonomuraea endophytica TaxID=714136 RepID=A0A7W8ABP4_9ACTN|nr:hypothetical protein [Nonomuraea endophytica]MBB5083311.1 hypothetical protein [Nonomuraea endophytica]
MKVFRAFRQWWLRRRDLRITGLGGMPFQEAHAPPPPRNSFRPTPVDRAGHLVLTQSYAERLAPGTDELTAGSLDNLINAWHETWQHQAAAEYAGFQVESVVRLNAIEPALAQYEKTDDYLQRRLADARTAVDSARERLAGQDPARPGFADPPLLAGRSPATFLHVVALVMAAGADAAAFWQVMQILLADLPPVAGALIVAGLTTTALYLSHQIGVQAREAGAGTKRRIRWVVLCFLVWLVLGVGAAALRYFFGDAGAPPAIVIGGPAATPDLPAALGMAGVFLALYLATGLVAALGGYLTTHPARSAYARAMRNLRTVTEAAAASSARLSRAQSERMQYAEELREARQRHLAEMGTRAALAEELKQMVRVHHAAYHQDPSATDAMFQSDHRPHWKKDP